MQLDALEAAVRQCPFLSNVRARQGESYARNLAANPFVSASGPLLLEDGLSSFAATLKLFHGPGGVVPLKRFAQEPAPPAGSSEAAAARPRSCPFATAAAAQAAAAAAAPQSAAHNAVVPSAAALPSSKCGQAAASVAAPSSRMAAAPFASMSLSGFGFTPDLSQMLNRPSRSKQQRAKQQRKPDPGNSRSGGSGPGTSSSNPVGSNSGSSSSSSSTRSGAMGASSPGVSSGSGGTGGLRSGPKPGSWGHIFGGLIPLAANGHLTCPAPIVKMRAAVAALKPVRDLRPQALPIRAIAMAGTAIAANLPCGAWREHTRKFSPQWFLAVHATIPFVAMLRKAVLMPKWAILLTLAGSIAGQSVGARIERERLRQLSERRRQPGIRAASKVPAADCVMPGLEEGCRKCVQAAGAAIAWTLAPVVVQ